MTFLLSITPTTSLFLYTLLPQLATLASYIYALSWVIRVHKISILVNAGIFLLN